MTTMSLFDEDRTYSVGELTDAIAGALSVSFPDDIWVEGEIRNLRRPRSGHVYFDLVEPTETTGSTPAALLSVMLFRATREIVNKQLKRAGGGMRMDDGVLVRLRAVPDLYAPQGRLQLRMTGIDPTYTMGQLEMQRERLLATMRDEGLLEQNAALPFPPLPLRVGLVTAADSAAYADFCTELGASNIGFRVTLVDTPTQGDMAPAGVAAAIATLGRHGVDLIAVVRGGGARTDLAAFDHELVARAIANCRLPVITGIGHEIDSCVADSVAHHCLKTPTAAAADLVERVRSFEARAHQTWNAIARRSRTALAHHEAGLVASADVAQRAAGTRVREATALLASHQRSAQTLGRHRLTRAGTRVEHAASRITSATPLVLAGQQRQLEESVKRIRRSAARSFSDAGRDLRRIEQHVSLLDPVHVLARGWSITRTSSGAVVRSVDDVPTGQGITTLVADGTITSTVTNTQPAEDAP